MEQTFMTISDLSPTANILFVSDSITDILGYQPSDVQDKSCFDFFHPDEVPFARSIHSRGILLDKAAVLHYARIISQDGRWVSCECCFTVVHDVLVACVSVYRRGEKSQRRAIEAPQIRRIFSCSPRDPRYHMLEHLSPKFRMAPMGREPRAALILNRFTRSLGIMFSTDAISSIIGLEPEHLQYKSFYECIRESCLRDAVNCLESAKANDSIAYLRFWSRDPRRPEDMEGAELGEEDDAAGRADGTSISSRMNSRGPESVNWPYQRVETGSLHQQSDSDSGGVRLDTAMDIDRDSSLPHFKVEEEEEKEEEEQAQLADELFSHSNDDSAESRPSTLSPFTTSTSSATDEQQPSRGSPRWQRRYPVPSVELEAAVSCTSDGLVVVLRKAHPVKPSPGPSSSPTVNNGVFAAPWGQKPMESRDPSSAPSYTEYRPFSQSQYLHLQDAGGVGFGPSADRLMQSIRDVAVFAWALVGINGTLAEHSRGVPSGEAQPVDGLPVWDPLAGHTDYQGPDNQATRRNI